MTPNVFGKEEKKMEKRERKKRKEKKKPTHIMQTRKTIRRRESYAPLTRIVFD